MDTKDLYRQAFRAWCGAMREQHPDLWPRASVRVWRRVFRRLWHEALRRWGRA